MTSLLTPKLSPVKADSSTVRFLASIILRSAFILSPEFNKTMSPTTKLVESILTSSPFRKTVVWGLIKLARALAVFKAFIS